MSLPYGQLNKCGDEEAFLSIQPVPLFGKRRDYHSRASAIPSEVGRFGFRNGGSATRQIRQLGFISSELSRLICRRFRIESASRLSWSTPQSALALWATDRRFQRASANIRRVCSQNGCAKSHDGFITNRFFCNE